MGMAGSGNIPGLKCKRRKKKKEIFMICARLYIFLEG